MSTQGDLERADPGPNFDGQRDEQVGKTQKDAKKITKEESALVAAWMHRIQTLTLITTFLTSIDGELFTLTSTSSQVTLNASEESVELVYACFTGALVFHGCSCEYRDGWGSVRHLQLALAILGYVASFALIRYQIVDAETHLETDELEKRSKTGLHHHESIHGKQLLLRGIPPLYAVQSLLQMPSRLRIQSRTSCPPLDLLTRCYYTILGLSGAGFILALLGIATYAWVGLQRVVGIFTMACLGVSLLLCVCVVVY
ncbi:hypothetical protein DFJ58DRAFT_426052 [Suillus subalutaceus]|uniref:uncharacterized protein n=1 Tax=Suillus subalutaceus TaxID=48586 RepID=UPI001B860D84|nr:uncharacterized protein DFJ58DRAFT_426052 [Suillus subalutaceus]KAG1851299.1 hypothetical protein DFJ58DRAFT_426052 [Suillus subalutaceus]